MPRTFFAATSSAGTAALLFAVSACGGSSATSGTATPTTGTQQNQSARPGRGLDRPAASGKVAAISGKTLQVQSAQSGQVAVTYTARTTFTRAVQASSTAVTVGSCVLVRGSGGSGGAATASGPVAAASVALTKAVNGHCGARGGPGVGGGFGAAGGGGTRPSGAPTGGPGAGRGTGGFGGARPVSGLVTAVRGSSFTVESVSFGAGGAGAAGGSPSPSATPSTSPVTVTTTAATTYTKTVSASAKDLAVGKCVTAIGSADDTGAVTATAIISQPAVNGDCAGGFCGFGGRQAGSDTSPPSTS
jgi:hypothetical protein